MKSALKSGFALTVTLLAFLSLVPVLQSADAPPVREVVIVFKTHFDIGYTDMASNVVKRYRTTMIDDALKVVDQSRALPPEQQFAWTLPGWPLSQIMADWPGQTPERQRRVRAAFKEGRFVAHALPFTTHTELLDIEDLVRGLGYSSRLSREAGLSLPRDAKMTDVPCHSWIMPTLLKHAGVDFLHLGCNAASSSPKVPRLFLWEGPDGSRLLTMYTAESYGTGLVPPKDWPYQTWLALIHTGDNHGPPAPAEVKKLLADAEQKLPGVKVRIGRLSDFADGILAEKADIPVVRGDMPDTWIHGPMSDPAGAAIARNIRPAITMTETLHTLLNAWGVKQPDISATLAQAREQSLLYGEHTWGGAQYWVTKYGSGTKWGYGDAWRADHEAKRFQRLEDSWAEHTAYIEKARDLVEPLLQRQLKALAEAVNQPGERIVVVNPLPWTRYQGVAFLDAAGFRSGKPVKGMLVDVASRERGIEPLLDSDGKTMRCEAYLTPPMGYRTYSFEEGVPGRIVYTNYKTNINQMRASGTTAKLDPARGIVRSLKHESDGELVDENSPVGFGEVLYERFDSNQVAAYVKSYVKINADWAVNELGKPVMPPAALFPYRGTAPTKFTITYSGSSAAVEAAMTAAASRACPFGVTTRVVLYENMEFVDLEVTLHKKPADPWPEAAWLCLPFNINYPQFRVGRQGSIIDPAKDIVPGANQNLYAVDTGVAIFDPSGRGVGICPLDNALVSLGEPGGWKYTPGYVPTKPVVYINLFNNQWTTNFRMWNSGTWRSRVRIWIFKGFDPERSLIRPALEARYPLVAMHFDGLPGNLPVQNRGMLLTRNLVPANGNYITLPWAARRHNTLPTAFGPNPDGPGTLLRLWEYAGQSGPCYVTLPAGIAAKSVRPVNLRGQPLGPAIPIIQGQFRFESKAFAPASFIISSTN